MFCIGDTVKYSNRGLCKIEDITEINGTEFYVMSAVSGKNKIFVPKNAQSEEKMRKVLSLEEINAMIDEAGKTPIEWIDDDKERRTAFREILARGDRTDLMRVIRAIYEHRKRLKEKGRKLHLADERIIQEAEAMLHSEIAYVLNITPEQVVKFIAEKIKD